MTRAIYLSFLAICWLATVAVYAQNNQQYSPKAQERIIKEVRHRILMLPQMTTFDNIAFKVEGYDVTLIGQVRDPTIKSDAERVVKKIEGVEHVDNRIEILPASPGDDRLRRQLFYAIYRYGPLQHYGIGSNRPIRIIVNHGHVTLEGVVDRESDKNLAGMRANGVPGVFSVDNNLVVPGKNK